MPTTWTEEAVRDLGVRTNLDTSNSVLGMSRNTGYGLAAKGEYPVKVLRIGRKYVVPVAGLLEALGLNDEEAA